MKNQPSRKILEVCFLFFVLSFTWKVLKDSLKALGAQKKISYFALCYCGLISVEIVNLNILDFS